MFTYFITTNLRFWLSISTFKPSIIFFSSVEVFECPDYHKAGDNSCYFDKRHTSIWIIYNITVVASNTLGKAYSESVEVDVMDIGEFIYRVYIILKCIPKMDLFLCACKMPLAYTEHAWMVNDVLLQRPISGLFWQQPQCSELPAKYSVY